MCIPTAVGASVYAESKYNNEARIQRIPSGIVSGAQRDSFAQHLSTAYSRGRSNTLVALEVSPDYSTFAHYSTEAGLNVKRYSMMTPRAV